jgi:hypothetical protein
MIGISGHGPGASAMSPNRPVHTPDPHHHDAPTGPVLPGQPDEDPIPPEMSPDQDMPEQQPED